MTLESVSVSGLGSVDSLGKLLHAFDLNAASAAQPARAHAHRVRGIRAVEVAPGKLTLPNGTAHGFDIHLTLSRRDFGGEAEAFFFARVVAELFGYRVPVDAFARTRLTLLESGKTYAFEPRSASGEWP
jgi:type VI protein secretion system component VasA